MEIMAIAFISAVAVYVIGRHMKSSFNGGDSCHSCGGCKSKCPSGK